MQALNVYLDGAGRPKGRGAKINRTVIARQLGVTKSALTPHIAILASYESRLEVQPNDLAKIPHMVSWLSRCRESGTLETFNNSQISRKQFFQAFEVTSSTLLRYPEIEQLLKPYDEMVASGEYLQAYHREKLQFIREHCSTSEFIAKDGKTFAFGKAAALVGLSEGKLRRRPYNAVIEEIVAALRLATENNPLVAVTKYRDYDFRFMAEIGFSDPVSAVVVSSFRKLPSLIGLHWLNKCYDLFCDFAKWFARSPSHTVLHCFDFVRVGRAESVWPNYWAEAHTDFGAHIFCPTSTLSGAWWRCINANPEVMPRSLARFLPTVSSPLRLPISPR